MTQPFFTTEKFTGIAGRTVTLDDTITGWFCLLPRHVDLVTALVPVCSVDARRSWRSRRRQGTLQALSALAQQPDEANTITRTLFVGLAMVESTAIYCFVVSIILLFANSLWSFALEGTGG